MKVILLAGGRGTRISNLIGDVPKCTLKINSIPIVRRTVEIFLRRGIDVTVCTGFKSNAVEECLNDLNVKFYFNPFYSVTNSLGTLWFARNEIEDSDIFIMNADVFFDEKIIDKLLNSKFDVAIATDKNRILTGDYFFSLDNNDNVIKYGKNMPIEERSCEYVGIIYIKKSFLESFNREMNHLITNEQYGLWWENILYSLAESNKNIKAVDCSELFWGEVDTYEDYERIINHCKTNKI